MNSKYSKLILSILIMLLLMDTAVAAASLTANSYDGGIPLTTVQKGTVSGGLWYDSYPGFATSAQKTFIIPEYTDIKWARLYVAVYNGNMKSNYEGNGTIDIDANGDGSYELQKSETFNTPYSFPGAGGTGPVLVNDHMNRVTSDYLMWYDLEDVITGQQVNVQVKTAKIGSSSFDGRIKAITLVVAYDDGDADQVQYWINQGHDTVSPDDTTYDTGYTGSTSFETSTLPASWSSANFSVIYLASKDGTYKFQGNTLDSGSSLGSFYGTNVWDISNLLSAGQDSVLTYDKLDENSYYKIPLAFMSVRYASTSSAPAAEFAAVPTSGVLPLTVNFTDQSTGSPTEWLWDFGDGNSATAQNASHTYTSAGNYTVSLKVTNAAGSNTTSKKDYITAVTGSSQCDLTISGTVNPVPASAVFAKEPNPVKIINVKNNGPSAATNIPVALYASDVSNGAVPVNTTTIASLASGEAATITLIDPTIRNLEGGAVNYTAVVDPDNLILETSEVNNNKTSLIKTVKYNGYKGKRYWEGGSDITTKETYDLHGNLLFSTQPASAYSAVGWTGRTETWTSSDLPIPSGATIEKALLYVSYNWDTTSGGVPAWTATFNGNSLTNGTLYTDRSNFGPYADQMYGLYTFDVTDQFNPSGNNLILTPGSDNKNALYPSTLVVIYRNPAESRKQIFINSECDELGYSELSYGTTSEEATAYAPLTGMSIDINKVQNARLYSFAGSAGVNEGNLLFNSKTVATNAWQGESGTSSPLIFDVKDYISATGNEAGIQSTDDGGMLALQQILVIEYPESALPVADFTAEPVSGSSPLTVNFTDKSTGSPISWAWDFDNDGKVDSTEQNPLFTYSSVGNYTVNLTVTNIDGSDSEVKTGYITVSESLPAPPVAVFTAAPTSGNVPLVVNFTDQSTGAPTEWLWDFGDGVNATAQNVSHTYTSAGNYAVKLKVANAGGSNSSQLVDWIKVTESPTPADRPDIIVSAVTPNADEIFANEANNISAKIENKGTAFSGTFTIRFTVSGINADVTVDGLSVGANTTLSITDPAIRAFGDSVTITATADPENAISELNETNNQLSAAKFVVYNGYKGKRYTGGNDITTQAKFEGKCGIVYSAGNTAYTGANWTVKTYSWSSTDLPIPAGATVESARLYQPYTWNKMITDPAFTMSFNSNTVTPIAVYKDRKSYGTSDYPYGLYVYDVTSLFNPAGNSITVTPEIGNNYGMYGAYLVVVYKDSTSSEKKIWINEEYDLLASKNTYAVTSDEATAYSPFNDVNTTDISKATAITILASGNDAGKNKFYFNDQEYTGFWADYQTSPQIGFSSYDVTGAVQSGTDTARIQSFDTGAGGDSMSAMNVILVTEYSGIQNTTQVPVAAFTAAPTSGDVPLVVNFTDQSLNSPTDWFWDFGDGNSTSGQNVSHTYTSAGNYTVNLTVTNEAGSNSSEKIEYIIVSEPPAPIEPSPIAAFIADVTSGTVPLTVNFTDQSTGTPTEWFWNFGDGTSDTGQNVSHTYISAGNYEVNLTVRNANGINSTFAAITVSEKPIAVLPVANFSTSVTEGYAPLTVHFMDLSENATERTWDFGDGVSSTEQNPAHTYSAAGSYEVTLTAKNVDGQSTKTGIITVKTPLQGPIAAFSGSPTSGSMPLKVSFTDNSAGSPTSWRWSFGDGTYSTAKNPVHWYTKTGKYTVSLTVKNNVGRNTATKSGYINVINPVKVPVAAFSASPSSGYAPLKVSFTDKSSNNPASWKWSFGDGTYSTAGNPVHTYSKAGKYTVSLTVKNSAGSNTIKKSNYINVETLKTPVAAFSASPRSGKTPLKVSFTDKSSNNPASWKWNFGDGTYSTAKNPVHWYTKAGKYTVSLTVKNAKGSNTKTVYNYIVVSKK